MLKVWHDTGLLSRRCSLLAGKRLLWFKKLRWLEAEKGEGMVRLAIELELELELELACVVEYGGVWR